jgi:GntR family transcriptional regulator, rspAB operon transcriptional repressor
LVRPALRRSALAFTICPLRSYDDQEASNVSAKERRSKTIFPLDFPVNRFNLSSLYAIGIQPVYKMFTKTESTTSATRLYRKIKEDIISCEMKPGTSFSEADFTRHYKVSRTPVREACRRLHDEGFINIIAFRGYSIAPLTVAEFHSLQELQLIVDSSAAGLAAERSTPEQNDQLQTFAEFEYKVGVRASYYEFLEQNRAFHVGIAEATGNNELAKVVASVHTKLMRYFYLSLGMNAYGTELVKEHLSILRAIQARDAAEAQRRTRKHILNTMERSARSLSTSLIDNSILSTPVLTPRHIGKPKTASDKRAKAVTAK